MKNLLVAFLLVALLAFSQMISAYEVQTHQDTSQAAFNVSVLQVDDGILHNLGLKPVTEKELFPNFRGELQTIEQLIQFGSEQEDDYPGSRFLHHFYDPTHEKGLDDITQSGLAATQARYGNTHLPLQKSFDWALEDTRDLGGDQLFSFKDARQHFFYALTGNPFLGPANSENRKKDLGLTFQILGHVIHHIQDMAQPQHVKDEAHPVLKVPGTDLIFYAPGGLYEHYTDEQDIREHLPFSGYEPVFSLDANGDHTTFNTPRKLWETSDGKGIAQFTNRNFITYRHNFVGSLTNVESNPSYPNPDGTTARTTSIDISGIPVLSLEPTPLAGKMYFFGTQVADNYRSNQSGPNNLTSTFSLYDDDLKNFHLRVSCLPDTEGTSPSNCTQEAVFSINRFTMRAAHSFLIPRAVGYSAGLINFFFRGVGKIDLVPDPQNIGGYLIQNLSEEALKGTFSLYYDDTNDARVLYQTWPTNGDLLPHGQLAVAGFPAPTDPNHAPKNPGQYMLVFKGKMGQEGDDPSIPNNNPNFAVAANSINFGSGGLILTSGGDARGFAIPGNGGSVLIETGASLALAPPATQALEVNSGATIPLATGQSVRYSQISIRGTLELQGDVTLSSDGPVLISGTIKARSTTNPQDGANLTIESTGPVVVTGRINASGQNADPEGTGDQNGGVGGNIIIRTASTSAFTVPTIITRGGDAAFIYLRDPIQQNLTGGHGGHITIRTLGSTPGVALQFAGERLPDSAVDPLPKQQGAHQPPTRTTFHRGLLTTGGYGGQFGGPDGVSEAGAPGGSGGNITIECQQPAQVQFAETDLFTGGNIDVILSYQTEIVFIKGDRPRFQSLVQRTGSMGGQGSHGVSLTNGGDGGPGGNAGAITVSPTCTLAPAPATLQNPPRLAPLFDGVDPRAGFSSKLPIVEALDTAGNRLYTLQAFGGGGGIPGGSGLSLARCASTGSSCFVEDGAGACPLLSNGTAQLCLPVPGIEPSPGNYGPRGADGPVSCLSLGLTPPSPAQEGLICQ